MLELDVILVAGLGVDGKLLLTHVDPHPTWLGCRRVPDGARHTQHVTTREHLEPLSILGDGVPIDGDDLSRKLRNLLTGERAAARIIERNPTRRWSAGAGSPD